MTPKPLVKKEGIPLLPTRFFQLGEVVEFHKGGLGKVIKSFGDCGDILWEDNKLRGNPMNSKKGRNVSITIPLKDLGIKFNPIIRSAKYANQNPTSVEAKELVEETIKPVKKWYQFWRSK